MTFALHGHGTSRNYPTTPPGMWGYYCCILGIQCKSAVAAGGARLAKNVKNLPLRLVKGPRGSRWPQMHVDLC